MNYIETIKVLEELKSQHPEYEDALESAIKTMRNIDKAMGYSRVKE